MVEAFIEHMWVMAGIFALLVIVVFSVRGGQKARRETVRKFITTKPLTFLTII